MSDLHISTSEKALDNSFWSILKEAIRGSERDFTEGTIGKAIFILAVPMIFEMFAEGLFAVIDIIYVAKLGANAVAVVGITETVLALVYAVAVGLSVGATATIARRIGEGDTENAAKTAFHVIILGLIVSFVLGIIGFIFAEDFLRLVGADEEVIALGLNFARIMFAGNFSIIFLFVLNAIFRGAGDAAISMRVLWLANILNIILAPIFIFVLNFGVTGAAIATTIGRTIGVLFAFYALFKANRRIVIERKHCQIDVALLWNLVKLSSLAVLQFIIGTASWIGLMKVVSKFGNEAIAGYTIGIRIFLFILLPSIGISNASATLVGQNLGANKLERAEKTVWKAGIYNAAFLTSIGVFFIIFAHWLASLLTDEPNVVAYAADSLRIISFGLFFYGFGMVFESSFNGAGDTRTPTLINLFVLWLFEIPLAYILANHFGFGAYGVFWAITISFSILACVSGLLFKRGKWKLKKV